MKGATESSGGVGGRGRIAGFDAGADVSVLGGEGSGRLAFAFPLPLYFFSLGSRSFEEIEKNSMLED